MSVIMMTKFTRAILSCYTSLLLRHSSISLQRYLISFVSGNFILQSSNLVKISVLLPLSFLSFSCKPWWWKSMEQLIVPKKLLLWTSLWEVSFSAYLSSLVPIWFQKREKQSEIYKVWKGVKTFFFLIKIAEQLELEDPFTGKYK